MKHLIYLIDGTWMFSGDMSATRSFTNIHFLNNYLEYRDKKEVPQIVHYKRGIGSAQERFRRVTNSLQGIFGLGIWNDIEEIYLNICSNFEFGPAADKLYLFGFSRGAAVARAVAELIDIGILKMDKLDHVADAIEIYRLRFELKEARRKKPSEVEARQISLSKMEGRFRQSCHEGQQSVEFLGLFDTVIGGIYISRKLQELNMLDSAPSNSVKATVQLLSMDERRNLFRQSHFSFKNERVGSILEQIWFPGVHTNVGGGSRDDHLSRISLLTMIDRVLYYTDLKINYSELESTCRADGPITAITNEWTLKWLLLCGLHKLNIGGRRKPMGVNATLHPAAKHMTANRVYYKSNPIRVYYKLKSFENLNPAPLFISTELSESTISV